MKKVCERCKRLREHEARGLCKKCYTKERHKHIRNRNLKKRFGFIPKLFMYNKDVTSDGCFYGNSKIADRFNNYVGKLMFLYECDEWPNEYYKIQVINCNTKEEFWFRSYKSREWVNRFFNRLKSYPVNFLRHWENESKT